MFKAVAPSGSPIHLSELGRCLVGSSAPDAALKELEARVCSYMGLRHAFLLSTGRAAMTLLLRTLKRRRPESRRRTVVVPSYTCYSVAASVLKAGLDVLVCDVDESTLCYDMELLDSIDFDKVLAIVSANLYGIPNNLPELEAFAAKRDVYLIDDAAQSFGAAARGRKAGSFGVAGILSLDKGKNITSVNGGIIVTNDDSLAASLQQEHAKLDEPDLRTKLGEIAKVAIYFSFLHPALYWIPRHAPFIGLGSTVYDETYPIRRYFGFVAPIANGQLGRIEDINSRRAANAAVYASALPAHPMVRPICVPDGSEAVYLRYPLKILEPNLRAAFLRDNRRLGCSPSYPASICEIPEIKHHIRIHNKASRVGPRIAKEIVTLPTHAFVQRRDIDAIARSLRALLDNP